MKRQRLSPSAQQLVFRKTPYALAIAAALAIPPIVIAAAGDPAGGEFLVNTSTIDAQARASVAMDADGDFVVVWQSLVLGADHEIYAQRYNAGGAAQGVEFRVNTYTSSSQTNPAVAMDADGDFVVAWQSYGQDGQYNGVYAQRYNASGTAQGVEFRVNTYTSHDQSTPAVAMDADGDFVVAWQSYGQDGDYEGVYAQRYTAGATAQGAEFRVSTHTSNEQRNPAIAMDADGDFVVAWNSFGQDGGSSHGVYAQRYNAGATAQGVEFQVHTTTTNDQLNPAVAMDADGDFVVAWQSYYQDGDSYGVYFQRYNAGGTAQGVETRVNTYTANSQRVPAVAMDADGDFVVAWSSYEQDGSYEGIFAQRYNAGGTAQGIELQVNTYITDSQFNPAVAMDADGDFVAAWHSYGQDGDYDGIYAQRYAGADAVLGGGGGGGGGSFGWLTLTSLLAALGFRRRQLRKA